MLTVIRTEDGEIKGCCEWCRCDASGTRNKDGQYVWISELEVNVKYVKVIHDIIHAIDKLCGDASFVYFWRSKYNKRIRVYPRDRFLNFVRGRECLV